MHQGRASDYFATMAQDLIASQLIWNCLTAKRVDYTNEQEVRYIIMGECKKFDGLRKTHGSKLYVELPLKLKTPGAIRQICVGPLAPIGSEEMIREFLQAQVYPEGIPICRSVVRL